MKHKRGRDVGDEGEVNPALQCKVTVLTFVGEGCEVRENTVPRSVFVGIESNSLKSRLNSKSATVGWRVTASSPRNAAKMI